MEYFSKDEKEIIDNAKNYIIQIFKDDSSGHDAEHSLRVYKTALEISTGSTVQPIPFPINLKYFKLVTF